MVDFCGRTWTGRRWWLLGLLLCGLGPAFSAAQAVTGSRYLGTASWSPPAQGWPVLLEVRDLDPAAELVLLQERGRTAYLSLAFQTTDGLWLEDPILMRLEGVLAAGQMGPLNSATLLETGRQALRQQASFQAGQDILRISIQPVGDPAQVGSLLTSLYSLAAGAGPTDPTGWSNYLLPLRGNWVSLTASAGVQPLGFLQHDVDLDQGLILKTTDCQVGDEVRWQLLTGPDPTVSLDWVAADGRRWLRVYSGSEPAWPLPVPPAPGFWRMSLQSAGPATVTVQLVRVPAAGGFILRSSDRLDSATRPAARP